MTQVPPTPRATPPAPLPRARWTLLAVMVVLMATGHLDRQVVVALFPLLREAWQLSDAALGSLVSIVSLAVALCTVPLALLADRAGHARAIVAMVLLWSAATVACAAATSLAQLLALRALVGVGEAAFGAVGAALLAARLPESARATVLGTFIAAALIGNAVGVLLGAWVGAAWGWKAAFVVAGLPGLALAAILVALADKDGGKVHAAAARERTSLWRHVRDLLADPTLRWVVAGGSLQVLSMAALSAWLPSWLGRRHGYDVAGAGTVAATVLFAGVAGAILWSAVSDYASARRPAARTLVPAAACAATALLVLATFGFAAPPILHLSALVAMGLVMTGTLGPTAALVVSAAHPSVRATAAALLALAQNLVGLAGGPLVVGLLSDAVGLDLALATVVPLASLGSAAAFLLAAQTAARHRQPAEARP